MSEEIKLWCQLSLCLNLSKKIDAQLKSMSQNMNRETHRNNTYDNF